MSRRKFFVLLASPFVATAAVPPEPETVEAANAFKDAWNRWVLFRRQMGIVDAKEILAWKEVRRLWKKLDKTISYE